MACCAMPGGCDDPNCYLCSKIAQRPQPPKNEPAPAKADSNPERDGDPKLAAERKRALSRKSNRAGPNWVPHDRRV